MSVADDEGALPPEPVEGPSAPGRLTHVDAAGRVRMVDVGAKPVTARVAVARGVVVCSEAALAALRGGSLPKGDGLAVARVAGIMAAKRTGELIPLCHPLGLDAVEVDLSADEVVQIEARVRLHGRTGVEMEALTAVAVAGLTVIDMIKAIDRGASLRSVRVVSKSGGASGGWAAGERVSALPLAGVLTVSDRAFTGEREDLSGPLVAAALARAGARLVGPPAAPGEGASIQTAVEGGVRVVPDSVEAIRAAVLALAGAGARIIVTSGGTGLAPGDVTPEALAPLLTRPIPGLAEALRAAGAAHTATAALSRTLAGVLEQAEGSAVPAGPGVFVVALPGSPAAVAEAMAYLSPLLGHIVDQLDGGDHPASRPDPVTSDRSGDPRIVEASVGGEVIEVAALETAVRRAGAGAVVTFTGVVRNQADGREVVGIDYEAYPDAGEVLRQVLDDLMGDHPAVAAVAAMHRLGSLAVGDVAFGASLSAAHRREAFAACADLVERVKAALPVWKRQHFADGADEWVGL